MCNQWRSVALSSLNLLGVAWDEGQVEDKALGSGRTWALLYYGNNGHYKDCGVTWLLVTSPEKIRGEKEKLKAVNVELRIQWPVRKAWWQL